MPSPTPAASPETGTNKFKGLQLGITLVGVLVIVALAGSSAYDAWRSYRYTVAANEREIANVANALAEQTAWSLQAVDLLLIDSARWYRDESHDVPAAGFSGVTSVSAALGARAAAVKQVREVIIMDAHGDAVYRSRGIANLHNAADRSYFIAQRDSPDAGLFISEPLTTRSEGRPAIILSRRLDDVQGHFAGVVIANVDLEELDRFYQAVDVGSGSAIQLLRDDATLIVRNPHLPGGPGGKYPALITAAVEPTQRVISPIDGRVDFLALAIVRNTALRLAVTRDAAIALRPWRTETINVAARTLVVTLLGALGLAMLLRQIGVLKRAQLDKEQLETQLRQSQKMEAIGTLAGGIAHDFNNVLGAILGYGELALQHSAEHSDLRRYLDNVMLAAERAKMLVERILGFSRSGLSDLVLVNVEAVVRETLELLEASLPVGIRLDPRLSAGNAAVMADPTYLHQVTMNLCTNAVQAMAHGGVLGIAVERRTLAEPRVLPRGSLAAQDYVRLTVTDTGAGIPPAVLDRIFDPFFTTKSVGEGTGLGLSLVHGIIADLGGAIDVSSTVGEGTRFDIWLPAAGEQALPADAAAHTLPRGNGEAVMIVDDEQPLVALAEELIAQLGYEPAGYVSSTAALQTFRAAPHRFDVILTDESMPDLVGTEFARQIRELRPTIPIILMSGRAVAGLVDRAAELGVNEVLRKPLHGRDIAEALVRVLAPPIEIQETVCQK